jgi:hypothetical protein
MDKKTVIKKCSKSEPLKVKKGESVDGTPSLVIEDHTNSARDTFGTSNRGLQEYFTDQLVRVSSGVVTPEGDFDEKKLLKACNNSLAILHGVNPKDELETMLVAQMIGCHNVAISLLERSLALYLTPEQNKISGNQATRMLRTFTVQMEALKKYRTGGQQKVTVEHVHVNEGGRAIVGNIRQGGGGSYGKKEG